MNLNTRDRDKALRMAGNMSALRGGRPVSVFVPYMPSVYPMGRTPYFADAMPAWITTPEQEEKWRAEQHEWGAVVVQQLTEVDQ